MIASVAGRDRRVPGDGVKGMAGSAAKLGGGALKRRLPKGARMALLIVKTVGVSGTAKAILVLLICSLIVVGSKYTVPGQAACSLPERRGSPGVLLFGDSALRGLADKMPDQLGGGPVAENVTQGRTAQRGVNELSGLPEDAQGTIVASLAQDDPGEKTSYTDRIQELMLTLSGRKVLWITVPGHDALNEIVMEEAAGEWQILDLAQSARNNSGWWSQNRLTGTGAQHLADTITTALAPAEAAPPPTSGSISVISAASGEQLDIRGDLRHNAQAIVNTGESLGVSERGLTIAIATALQESRLRNLDHGDRDSLGLFQQRPSQGWGTPEQIRDPAYASTQFFTRLLQVPRWEIMALTDAAQAVQRSAFPFAYAQWEEPAQRIVAALRGKGAPGCGPAITSGVDPRAQVAVTAALSQIGVPYVWGGGSDAGPTTGACTPRASCRTVGFDCSGLMLYAWAKSGVSVPHYTVAMWNSRAFDHIADRTQLQPGDMVMFHLDGVPEHVGMYIGENRMVHAPRTGDVVKTESLDTAWSKRHYLGALRPKA